MPHRRLEKETKGRLKRFYRHLTVYKGLSEETASRHIGQIEFFALHYLSDYREESLLDASGSDIEDYLGNWYIRKARPGTKTSRSG